MYKNYLEWASVKYSIYTVRNYGHYLNAFRTFINNKPLNKVSVMDIVNFQKHLKDKGLKNNTISFYSIAIRAIIKFYFLQEKLKLNPELIPIPKYVNASWKPAGRDVMAELIKHIGGRELIWNLRDELIVRFLQSSGCRVSELCDLSLDVINLTEQEAVIITKKNLKKRVIMWDDLTNELMCKYLDERLSLAKCDYVFVNKFGEKLSTRHVQRVVKELRKKAGIRERIVPHGFRHGFGMKGVEKNMNLRHLQILLGHKKLESTTVYMSVSDKSIRQAYKKIYN